jgi:glycine/D-amino acid oxidase-like deaminating enzyme
MRVVVIGGGVIGLLTAVECVKAGARTVLADRSGIPAADATSHDRYRVVRVLHRDDERLTSAAARARHAWLDVQRFLGIRFYHPAGALTVMAAAEVPASLALLTAAGAAGRPASAADVRARCPGARIGLDAGAVFEPGAGVVLASRVLAALADWLRAQPAACLRPRGQVTEIDEKARAVRLADGTELAADAVVVAAGPWSRELLPSSVTRDLTLYRQTMLSYAPPDPAWRRAPAMLGLGATGDAWLIPPVAGTSARLSAASASRAVAALDGRQTPRQWRDHLVARFADVLDDFDPGAVTGAADAYYLDVTEGGGPLLTGSADGAVTAYAACGGMSFKFAPLIARALADRALGRRPRLTGIDPIDHPRLGGSNR